MDTESIRLSVQTAKIMTVIGVVIILICAVVGERYASRNASKSQSDVFTYITQNVKVGMTESQVDDMVRIPPVMKYSDEDPSGPVDVKVYSSSPSGVPAAELIYGNNILYQIRVVQ